MLLKKSVKLYDEAITLAARIWPNVMKPPIAVDCYADSVCGWRVDDNSCIPIHCEGL